MALEKAGRQGYSASAGSTLVVAPSRWPAEDAARKLGEGPAAAGLAPASHSSRRCRENLPRDEVLLTHRSLYADRWQSHSQPKYLHLARSRL